MMKNLITEILDNIHTDKSRYINHDTILQEIGDDIKFIIDAIAEIIHHPQYPSNIKPNNNDIFAFSISSLFYRASNLINDIYTFDIKELKNKCDHVKYTLLDTCVLSDTAMESVRHEDVDFELIDEINQILENVLLDYFENDQKFYKKN